MRMVAGVAQHVAIIEHSGVASSICSLIVHQTTGTDISSTFAKETA